MKRRSVVLGIVVDMYVQGCECFGSTSFLRSMVVNLTDLFCTRVPGDEAQLCISKGFCYL
jgi:hypothetical protein